MKIKAFIFARGGSKGIKHKNLQKVGPHSLVGHAVLQALSSPFIDEVIISTDDENIAEEAAKYGAKYNYLRPDYLASDTANEWDAWRHAVNHEIELNGDFDTFVSIPPTAPLRTRENIDHTINSYIQQEPDVAITGYLAHNNPYFNMVSEDEMTGGVGLVCRDKKIHRRQDAPTVYNISTVCYVTSPTYILNEENLWAGKTILAEVSDKNAIDIDNEIDLEFARFIYNKENSNGETTT